MNEYKNLAVNKPWNGGESTLNGPQISLGLAWRDIELAVNWPRISLELAVNLPMSATVIAPCSSLKKKIWAGWKSVRGMAKKRGRYCRLQTLDNIFLLPSLASHDNDDGDGDDNDGDD